MKKKSVLILCPHPAEQGGVADYYRLVSKYFSSDRVEIEFFYTGKRTGIGISGNRIIKTINDLLESIGKIRGKDLVILNPSLDPRAVIRDGIFHLVAKRLYGRKTLVFFHGWDLRFESRIDRYAKMWFGRVFNFDRAVVLAREFKNKFVRWGLDPQKIQTETTVYEQYEFSFNNDPNKLIFLSRFVEGKGCLEAIQTVEILVKQFPGIKLYMVGDGAMTPELREYVESRRLGDNVKFTGWLTGEAKYRLIKQCGVMLYPTAYGEGLPISLLEGMGMGLVVVTRPVAGIPDIFVDGENGYLISTMDPGDFAEKVEFLLKDFAVWQYMSQNNQQQALEKFEISNVVNRLEQMYFETALGHQCVNEVVSRLPA